ncbi:uncharacterized protein METZ01_LOCUS406895, partial [marine metagenome]
VVCDLVHDRDQNLLAQVVLVLAELAEGQPVEVDRVGHGEPAGAVLVA